MSFNLTVANEEYNLAIEKAVARSISLVEKSATEYLNHRECFSCHHQSMPILALTSARQYGYDIDNNVLQAQMDHTFNHFEKNITRYLDGKGTGGQVDTAGYGLWALHAGGRKKSKTMDAVVQYLLQRDQKRVFWRRSSERPPSEASNFTATYVAVLALKNFGDVKHQASIDDRLKDVKEWVVKEKADDTEDLVFKLNFLVEVDNSNSLIKKMTQKLVELQNDDGGWSQLPNLKSDAYATATAMYALTKAKKITTADPIYVNGVKFLMKTQKADGSWYVKSRSSPFQEYFESGFPHGKDQFISITATCWAIMVMAAASPQ